MRNIRSITFKDLEFQNGKLVKVHPFDRYQYMSGEELIALVGRLGEMLYEVTIGKDDIRLPGKSGVRGADGNNDLQDRLNKGQKP